jgi:hypothetical protein
LAQAHHWRCGHEDDGVVVQPVDQQEVRADVALAVVGPVALDQRKRLAADHTLEQDAHGIRHRQPHRRQRLAGLRLDLVVHPDVQHAGTDCHRNLHVFDGSVSLLGYGQDPASSSAYAV